MDQIKVMYKKLLWLRFFLATWPACIIALPFSFGLLCWLGCSFACGLPLIASSERQERVRTQKAPPPPPPTAHTHTSAQPHRTHTNCNNMCVVCVCHHSCYLALFSQWSVLFFFSFKSYQPAPPLVAGWAKRIAYYILTQNTRAVIPDDSLSGFRSESNIAGSLSRAAERLTRSQCALRGAVSL